jgi:hypothetical protein
MLATNVGGQSSHATYFVYNLGIYIVQAFACRWQGGLSKSVLDATVWGKDAHLAVRLDRISDCILHDVA